MWKSTKQLKAYWENRKINWEQAYFTPDHPHRQLIIDALRGMKFYSIYEIGCGAGANLFKVLKNFPGVRVGGVDVNEDAVAAAKKHLPNNALVEHRTKGDIFMNDHSIDVILSDACLIYIDPLRINDTIKEIKRVARNNIVFVELHSSSFWERMKIRWRGYHAYDYKKLLAKHDFYNIRVEKIPKGLWDGTPWEQHGFIITAKI